MCAGGGGPCGRSADLIISYPHATVSHATFDQYFLLLSYPQIQIQMKRQIQIHNCMLCYGSFGSLFLYHLPPVLILIYSQYYKRAHVYKFNINSIVAYETRKMQTSEGKCGNVSKIIASSSPEGWMSRSGEEVALGAGDNSDLKTTMTKSKNIRELLAFVLWFSFHLCILFVIVFVLDCMAFAVH